MTEPCPRQRWVKIKIKFQYLFNREIVRGWRMQAFFRRWFHWNAYDCKSMQVFLSFFEQKDLQNLHFKMVDLVFCFENIIFFTVYKGHWYLECPNSGYILIMERNGFLLSISPPVLQGQLVWLTMFTATVPEYQY